MDTSMDNSTAQNDLAKPLDLPIEVWRLIGESIRSRSTLLELSRTCRTFYDLFTPFLCRQFGFDLTAVHPSEMLRKPLPRGLQYTRKFEVSLEEFPVNSVALHNGCSSVVARMLKEMTSLQSFRWIDSTYDESYRPSSMLRHEQLLQTLKQSSTLKHVSILFTSQYLGALQDAARCFFSLTGFKNLTSLELYNFYGEQDPLVLDIAGALARCPGLRTLGLSFACDIDCDNSPEVLIFGEEMAFFEKLCVEYDAQSEAHSLRLETLRLGHGMYLCKAEYSKAEKYLAKMVNLENLRNFYIYNGLVKWDIDDPHESMKVDWDQLEDCKVLQRLSVTRLETDLVQWLKKGYGSLIEELIVTEHYGMYDEGLDNFELLRLPRLSTLFIREKTVGKRSGNNVLSNNGARLTEPGLYLDLCSVMSILDRLYDNGARLTELGLCLDLETQWAKFSAHLLELQQLKLLRLDSKSDRVGQYPTKASSLWPGVAASQDIAYHYAKLIHSKCPSLQYIQIHCYSWRVAYRRDFATEIPETIEWVELVPLDQDEIASIELFAFKDDCSENGLPSTERASLTPYVR